MTYFANCVILSQLHWLPLHGRMKFKIATITYKLYTPVGNLHTKLYGLPLPIFSLLLVVPSLVVEVFARQLLLSRIVSRLTSILAKLSQHSAPTPEISPSFPFSLCHCLVTHLSISDSFTTTSSSFLACNSKIA